MNKPVVVIVLTMFSFVAPANNTKEQNANQVFKNALHTKNRNSKEINCYKEENNDQVHFKNSKVGNSILFNPKGSSIETEVAIAVGQLPKKAIQYLNNNFENKKVKEASKIITEKVKLIYKAEIKDKNLFFDLEGNCTTQNKVS